MSMEIGVIIGSESHVKYVARIFKEREVENPPRPEDCSLGKFVIMGRETVGIITNTTIVDPDYGRRIYGSVEEMRALIPDYLDEREKFVSIVAIGTKSKQGIISSTPFVGELVRVMDREEIRAFHEKNGVLRISYLPYLYEEPLFDAIVNALVDELSTIFEERRDVLEGVRKMALWKRMKEVYR
ncbi:MAG: hypothetical protein H5T46_01325 [Archaeoglobi archaeon]|nr:hypothetical protein [Candidatus Mnemosynella sp.]